MYKLGSILFPASVFMTPVKNYVLLYSTLQCKNNARAPWSHKTYIPTKLGGRNIIDPSIVSILVKNCKAKSLLIYQV